MSAEETQAQGEAQAETTEASVSLLDQAISATKQTERSRAEELLSALTEQALAGTVTWNKNVTATIKEGMRVIDAALSKQLAAIMQNSKFQKLEGSWRGLNHLAMNSETGTNLRIK